jgi:ring-1,2-phenylacetyl-CoA epoxidase subunit PaaC
MTRRSPAKAGAQERASAAIAAPWSPGSAEAQLDPRTEYLLRLGDDALVLGQRLGEWCGHGPVLEVDISLANLALDLIGQATLLLNEAADDGDGDRLAFHRDVLDFKNCLLVEQPNGDFAQTIARHLLYTTWQHFLLQRLTQSSDQFLRELAAKAVKEIAYHRELATDWTIRLGDGTEESARRMAEGLDWNWRFIPELFEVDETMLAAIDAGIAPDSRVFEDDYRSTIAAVLAEAQLEAPADQRPILGGRRGHHSEHLGHLLAPMQFLPRTYPDAKW